MNQRDERDTGPEIPDWKCERFLLGELGELEMDRIRRAANEDEHLRARLEAIERSNRNILDRYPPDRMGRQIRERLGSDTPIDSTARRPRNVRLTRTILVPAGLLAVIAFGVFVLPDLIPRTGPEVTRIKGVSPELRVHRKTVSGSQQLSNGDWAAEHDLILLQYRTGNPGYGVILSVDGLGAITRHLPERGNQAAELEPGRWHPLDHAYELDDAPGWEMFVFVTSALPFPVNRVVRAVEESLSSSRTDSVPGERFEPPPSLDLPQDFRVSSFTLIKDSGHEN